MAAKQDQRVKEGDVIKVHYTGTFDDGTVFDSSEGRDPLEFTVGKGTVIKGFDDGVRDMNVSQEKTIKVTSADGYGERDSSLVKAVPRKMLPPDLEPKPGMILSMRAPTGQQFMVKVDKVEGEQVYLDLNHPLAGKNLNFKLKIVEIA
ncbi:peptidylprolyl isomerase [Candidatus Woesearchaeota archaeon]|nr:peptidylprolyl isomerase [Candidatus Woesearchaeota archaeon]